MDVGEGVIGTVAMRCDWCCEWKETTIHVGQYQLCRECRRRSRTKIVGRKCEKCDTRVEEEVDTNDVGRPVLCSAHGGGDRTANLLGHRCASCRYLIECSAAKDVGRLQNEVAILRGEVKLLQEAYAKVVEERNSWTLKTAQRNQAMREMTEILGRFSAAGK